MILKGSQRGGARDLASHLSRTDENEHVEVHRLRGFAAPDLAGALNEMYAVSRGTKCRQFMYSVIFNPPPNEKVTTADFEAAIAQVEERFGLSGQPCALVFHEKKGRRHAHAVWSRIDTDEMKAVQLPFYKNKLQSISRDLFLEHGWTMPKGLIKSEQRDPTNFTLDEWQHAKRVGKDARAIKTAIQDAWAISDSKPAFVHALRERGYWLARGDSARFVAVDHNGEAYNIARSLPPGIKTKQIRQRLENEAELPGLNEVKKQIADDMLTTMQGFQDELDQRVETRRIEFERRRKALVRRQRVERRMLAEAHERRRIEESLARQARFRKGFKGLWDRVRGEHKRIREENEQLATAAHNRDQEQAEALIQTQLSQRRRLSQARKLLHAEQIDQKDQIKMDLSRFENMKQDLKSIEPVNRLASRFKKAKRKRSRNRGGPNRGMGM